MIRCMSEMNEFRFLSGHPSIKMIMLLNSKEIKSQKQQTDERRTDQRQNGVSNNGKRKCIRN